MNGMKCADKGKMKEGMKKKKMKKSGMGGGKLEKVKSGFQPGRASTRTA